jgi:hypothetical protein
MHPASISVTRMGAARSDHPGEVWLKILRQRMARIVHAADVAEDIDLDPLATAGPSPPDTACVFPTMRKPVASLRSGWCMLVPAGG